MFASSEQSSSGKVFVAFGVFVLMRLALGNRPAIRPSLLIPGYVLVHTKYRWVFGEGDGCHELRIARDFGAPSSICWKAGYPSLHGCILLLDRAHVVLSKDVLGLFTSIFCIFMTGGPHRRERLNWDSVQDEPRQVPTPHT